MATVELKPCKHGKLPWPSYCGGTWCKECNPDDDVIEKIDVCDTCGVMTANGDVHDCKPDLTIQPNEDSCNHADISSRSVGTKFRCQVCIDEKAKMEACEVKAGERWVSDWTGGEREYIVLDVCGCWVFYKFRTIGQSDDRWEVQKLMLMAFAEDHTKTHEADGSAVVERAENGSWWKSDELIVSINGYGDDGWYKVTIQDVLGDSKFKKGEDRSLMDDALHYAYKEMPPEDVQKWKESQPPFPFISIGNWWSLEGGEILRIDEKSVNYEDAWVCEIMKEGHDYSPVGKPITCQHSIFVGATLMSDDEVKKWKEEQVKEVEPCPFCGTVPIEENPRHYWHGNDDCFIGRRMLNNKDVQGWNTRSSGEDA